MATLNLSQNGPSIKKSYENVVNAPPPSGPAGSSSTYAQWAVYSVSAPLVSAFQQDGGKESVLKVQSTGEGELVDLVDEFSEGRIQFAFVKVKDPNSGLPKNVLIAWCGEGVPERTKGYFGSHLEAVSKLLHGYHVQVTARSEAMLTPEGIVEKVANASGSKYSGGGAPPKAAGGPPPVASKPVFQPTRVGGASGGFNPLGSRSRVAPAQDAPTDEDGWGADAPPVTRKQLEKVAPAYRPIGKVNLNDLTRQNEDASRSSAGQDGSNGSDVVRGGYQPVGKVDIAALRRQAKESGDGRDDRPTTVKGAYEPVGKVDIAAIRARAQGPGGTSPSAGLSPAATGASNRSGDDEISRPLADRSAAFQQSERLTTMPKPKVSNRFGSSSTFTGTKAPTPGGFESKPPSSAAPVGSASRTFADQGGKTPAQLWAEKKARERGASGSGDHIPAPSITSPVKSQTSGEGGWRSGYTGKSWAPVQTTRTGQSAASNLSNQRTGEEDAAPTSPAGGVSSIRDRFAGAAPMGAAAPGSGAPPPPMDLSSKPNAGARGVPIPGLPSRPSANDVPQEEHVNVPPPPAVPRSPTPPAEEDELRPSSPIRVAQPVGRSAAPMEAPDEPAAFPADSISKVASAARDVPPEPQVEDEDPARSAAATAAETTFGSGAANAPPSTGGGKRALIQYDYEKAEDNELELREGEYVTNIEMVDEDWWMGQNERGEAGLFPSNYVELVDDDDAGAAPPPPAPAAEPDYPAAAPSGGAGPTATALYDYEAAEDNELSFPDGATITGLEFPDDDWWFGAYGGKTGLFPANYVQVDE